MNRNVIKLVGTVASVVGFVAQIAGSWASEKETDIKIAKEIAKALSKTKES